MALLKSTYARHYVYVVSYSSQLTAEPISRVAACALYYCMKFLDTLEPNHNVSSTRLKLLG